jgi:EmrB/QacA subfamily drug resistance transporter
MLAACSERPGIMSDTEAFAIPDSAARLRHWFALPVILAGTFMITFDFFIVNVAIPPIERDLRAGTAAIEWVVAGYGLAYAALLITGGRLGDVHGRRQIFCQGLRLFTPASAACGVAPTAFWLVVSRFAQGIAAAMLAPQVLAILGTIYVGSDRARAFAAYGVVLGVASACGQVISGLLIQADVFGLGWRACFLVNIPIGVAALLLVPMTVPESRAPTGRDLDLGGAALVALGIGSVLLPLIEGRAHGWPAWIWLCFAGAAGIATLFVARQRRRAANESSPLIDPAVFQVRGFRTGLLAALILFTGVASSFFVLALYLQQGRGLTPMVSALVFTAMAVAFSVTSLVAARLGRWLGRAPLVPGALSMAVGLAALAPAVARFGVAGPVIWLLVPLAIDGAGMGLVMAPLASAVLAGQGAQHAGAAAGVLFC